MKIELKTLLPVSGIYAITNKITGKSYIGQSKNVIARWSTHVEELQKGTHTNRELQADWIKYGAGNFSATLLKQCDSEYLLKEESYSIREYRGLAGVYNQGSGILNFEE